MRRIRRTLLAAVLVLLVIGVVVLGLAAMALVAFPLAVVLELTVLALVAGAGVRLRRTREWLRRRRQPGPRWTTGWESAPGSDAVPLARGRLAVVLDEWGLTGESGEPALLVVTELVSNAAEHGGAPVRLAVEHREGVVRVDVYDGSADPPVPRTRNPARLRGRGLLLVDALCDEWGWVPEDPGKVVWAEVRTHWPDPLP